MPNPTWFSRCLAALPIAESASGELPLTVMRRRLATGLGALLLGIVALLFADVGLEAQALFARFASAYRWLPLLVSPAIFAGVAFATRRWAWEARGSGIPQVIAASRSPGTAESARLVSLRIGAAKLVLTIVMLFGGASVGREGPTVQVSASIMTALHRWLRVPITAGVLIAGGAAGVAAAFNTPLAGVAFAIEELAAAYEQRVAVLVMGAVMISGFVTLGIAGDYVYLGVLRASLPVSAAVIAAPVAGVAGGVAGGLFTRLVLAFGTRASGLPRLARARPIAFAAGCGLIVATVGIASTGATWGTGYEATKFLVEGHGQPWWFGPAKFVASLATTLSGAPGGVFAPSLAVGAGLGNLLTSLFPAAAPGAIVVLGMVAYFVGVVRAPLTAVIIVSEATANRGMIIPLFATALIAEAISALVCRERLYHGLSRAFAVADPEPAEQQ